MKIPYKVCFIIYKWLPLLFIPMSIVARFLVAAAGHNSDFSPGDYVLFGYIIVTVGLLTIYSRADWQNSRTGRILRYIVITLVSGSIVGEVYGLYDCLRNNDFSSDENILFLLFFLFTVNSGVVLWGIIKKEI